MCIIVDVNVASKALGEHPDVDFLPLLEWLQTGGGTLVVGGQLAEELDRLGKPMTFVIDLVRAGRARQIPDATVGREAAFVEETGHCRSNDPHVIALARVSGARTLCTHDKALQQDFRNKLLIDDPRGSIYQRKAHAHLLRHPKACGRLLKKRRR